MNPMAQAIVSRSTATKDPTRHQFVKNIGFLMHDGPPELPPGYNGTANCAPAADAPDLSVHVLQTPGDGVEIRMKWLADHRAWSSMVFGKGNRLAWTPDHLSRAGWKYVGPVDAQKKEKTKRLVRR